MADLISYPFSEQGLRDALVALGTTPEAVAKNLLAMGFKGEVDNCEQCPVARYLARSIEATLGVDVDLFSARLYSPPVDDEDDFLRADLPSPVKGFIELFDQYRYVDLLEDSDASS